MSYRVKLTREAEDDLLRLYDFVLERELDRVSGGPGRNRQGHCCHTGRFCNPTEFTFTCRKADQNPFLRELVIPFGGTGYVALFEIADNNTVIIAAVRHQREDDYH